MNKRAASKLSGLISECDELLSNARQSSIQPRRLLSDLTPSIAPPTKPKGLFFCCLGKKAKSNKPQKIDYQKQTEIAKMNANRHFNLGLNKFLTALEK